MPRKKPSEPRVRAHVVLRPAAGASPQQLPTAETIRGIANSKTVDHASKLLTELGFDIVGSSPAQVTIEAPKEMYERVFHSRLIESSTKGGARKSATAVRPKPADPNYMPLRWKEPPQIPQDLADSVATVVFPEPLQLHS